MIFIRSFCENKNLFFALAVQCANKKLSHKLCLCYSHVVYLTSEWTLVLKLKTILSNEMVEKRIYFQHTTENIYSTIAAMFSSNGENIGVHE
jgi:hypothetical protein